MTKLINNGIISGSNIFLDKVYQNQKKEQNLLEEIITQLIVLQEDRFIYDKTEPEKNKELRKLLRARGLLASEEVKQGRSGSEKKKNFQHGNLDIAIYDSENRQTLKSIVEALELKNIHKKTIKKHIHKLLHRYDTVGNGDNFVIVYSKSDKFTELWENYKNFVNHKIFPEEKEIVELEMSKARIKGGKNYYSVNNRKLCLYHLFVDMSPNDSTN